MNAADSLNDVALARQCLQLLAHPDSVLAQVTRTLAVIEDSSTGLGEVLQDFARQSRSQLDDIIKAARNLSEGSPDAQDIEAFQHVHIIMKTVNTVLQMTPMAMQRNQANTIGLKDRLSREEIRRVHETFSQSHAIRRLLDADNAGSVMLALLQGERHALSAAALGQPQAPSVAQH